MLKTVQILFEVNVSWKSFDTQGYNKIQYEIRNKCYKSKAVLSYVAATKRKEWNFFVILPLIPRSIDNYFLNTNILSFLGATGWPPDSTNNLEDRRLTYVSVIHVWFLNSDLQSLLIIFSVWFDVFHVVIATQNPKLVLLPPDTPTHWPSNCDNRLWKIYPDLECVFLNYPLIGHPG